MGVQVDGVFQAVDSTSQVVFFSLQVIRLKKKKKKHAPGLVLLEL